MVWPRRVLAALAVSTLSAAAAACSATTPGTPVAAPGPNPSVTLDISRLDPGNLPTEPAPPLGAAGSEPEGALIEARRMAENVVGPWEVDPALVRPSPLRATVLNDPAAVVMIEPTPGVALATQVHNFINGFASDRQGLPELRLMNAVLRFADPASAAAAAADMAAGAATDTVRPDSAVPIPGHPEARALNNTYNTYGSDPHPVTVVAFTAHGAYVLCQTAQAHETTSAAALITKTLDLQGPRIDQFVPTDPSKFADLLADPTGLLAHTMPPPMWPEPQSAAPANPKAGVYQPRAALHFQNDPPSAAAAFSAAGLIVMSHNHTFVYQARDAAAAARLTIDLANSVVNQDSSATPVDGVDFLPTSRCMQFRGITAGGPAQYSCYAPADAFTIEAHDADALGAHEQIAAQYKMLLAN